MQNLIFQLIVIIIIIIIIIILINEGEQLNTRLPLFTPQILILYKFLVTTKCWNQCRAEP